MQIEQHSYGGLFMRMPFRRGSGASVLNAVGQKDDETEQQAAAWVDLQMLLENSEAGAGITLLDDLHNPGHPVQWRVDGQRGINPAPCIVSSIELKSGEALRYNYRFILHVGSLAVEQIDKLWDIYAQKRIE